MVIVCCNRGSRGCATHALVENILSIIASIVLLYYDAQFLHEPRTCFWPQTICDITNGYSSYGLWWYGLYGYHYQNKLIAIKMQLACAAVMLAVSLAYIIIYIYTSLKVQAKSTSVDPEQIFELRHTQMPPPPVPVWPHSNLFSLYQ
jgi:hypothetical protein